jgi:uncharacterized membrane protein YphA (DoxX/SURF4 family)
MYHTNAKTDFLELRWDLFFQPVPLSFLLGSFILAALAWIVWKKREEKDFLIGPIELGATRDSLKLFYGWVPAILAIHVAITLLVNGIQGKLFTSNNQLEGLVLHWVGLAEILIALSLFYGGFTRPAAALLGFLWFLGIDSLSFRSLLESIQFLGFASFFYLAGRGPFSIDRLLFPMMEPNVIYANYALLILRIGVGLNIIVFGFTEKLANIPLGNFSLDHLFPIIKNLPDEWMVSFAGAAEVFAGLLIVFGIFPRTIIFITLLFINASLTVSSWNGMIDFLPIYGALAILLVWEPHNPTQKLLWVEGLRRGMPERPYSNNPF